ncbi:MAG: hypothetical protein GIW97_03560 [Candidatus Eremiobacteraeota bacterium]|nr:hypothetical protein [Candidatus Eremiobacteraeota bacterium]
MSKMLSSNRRAVAIVLCTIAFAACSKTVDVHSPQVRGVGYVRLDEILKKHPLYGQLSQIDSNIDALSLRALGPAVPKTGAEIARETQQLNAELRAAQARANDQLRARQNDFSQREQAAIRAAVVAAGENPGAAPAQAMQNTAAAQAASVTAQANSDFGKYQQAVLGQDQAAVTAVSRQLEARAERQYRQRADELSAKESQASLEMATRDSAQRISLRAKLNNLALDDALRAQVKAQLAALDRKESDAVATMRKNDSTTLAAYQAQLRAQTSADIAKQAGAIHDQTKAKLAARHASVSSQVTSVIQSLGAPAASSGSLSAATQTKIAQIDRQYKEQFKAEVGKTMADYNRTRTDLDARFAELHGVNATSQSSAARQLDALHRQRDQLYNQIVAQIQHEVQTIATARGLKVVFINLVAPVGGIDLTADAMKDVESLHE